MPTLLDGADGPDLLRGGPGDDFFQAAGGADRSYGGRGDDGFNDVVVPADGQVVDGGPGAHDDFAAIWFGDVTGDDPGPVTGRLDLAAGTAVAQVQGGTVRLAATGLEDATAPGVRGDRWTVVGTDGPNVLYAGWRSPVRIRAGGGADELYGSDRDDLLDGGAGRDLGIGLGRPRPLRLGRAPPLTPPGCDEGRQPASRATAAATRSSVAVNAMRTCRCAGPAVEVPGAARMPRSASQATVSQQSSLAGRPEVERRLGVVDPEARPTRAPRAARPAGGVAGVLLGDVLVVVQRGDHRDLLRAGHHAGRGSCGRRAARPTSAGSPATKAQR